MQVVLHASGGAVVGHFVFFLERVPPTHLILSVLPGGRRSRRQVAALLFGDMGLGSVNGFHVFPERAGVRVALGAAGDLTNVRFL